MPFRFQVVREVLEGVIPLAWKSRPPQTIPIACEYCSRPINALPVEHEQGYFYAECPCGTVYGIEPDPRDQLEYIIKIVGRT